MTSDTTPSPYVASASSNSSNPGYKPYLAFDGEANTSKTTISSWSSAENAGAAYVQLDIGGVIYVGGLRINASYNANGIMTPNRFYFQVSEDGSNWQTAGEFESIKWAPLGGYDEFMLDNVVKARLIRIGAKDVSSGETVLGRISYGDIQFWAYKENEA